MGDWAARAFADDARAWRAKAVVSALSVEGSDPPHAVASWIEAKWGALERAFTLLGALDREATDPLAVIALVLRRLNQVL